MRVVVFTAAYPSPAEPERAVYLETLTQALAHLRGAEELRLSVVAPRVHPSDPAVEERGGVHVRRFTFPSGGMRLKEIERPSPWVLGAYAVSALAALAEEVRSRAADVILAHWVLPSGPLAALAGALSQTPFVLVAHGSDVNRYALRKGPFLWAARWAVAKARRVVAVNAVLGRLIVERLGASPSILRVVPMGVDARLFGAGKCASLSRDESRRSLGLESGPPLLLFVGDLIPDKGILDLLAAIKILRDRGVAVRAAFAGAGPLERVLRAESPGLDLRVLGRVPQNELPPWYRAADLFVLPSHAEGSPVSLQEALASELPVVATEVGGVPELIEPGATGWLCPPRDPGSLAATLGMVLTSPGLLEGARSRLKASAEDHGAERRARGFRSILDEVARGL